MKTKNEKGIRYPFFVRKFENEKGKNGIYTDLALPYMLRNFVPGGVRGAWQRLAVAWRACVRACVCVCVCVCVRVHVYMGGCVGGFCVCLYDFELFTIHC